MQFPPNFQSYGYNLRPNAENAKLLIIFFRIVQGVLLLKMVLNISIFLSIKDGHVSRLAILVDSLFSVFSIIPYLLLAVFFMTWMSRAYYNLHKADMQDFNYGKNMAVLGWFIPIGSLFIPYQIIKEIHNDSQMAFREEEDFDPVKSHLPSYWWTFYLGSGLLAFVSFYLVIHSLPAEMIYFCNECITFSMLLSSVYGIAMIKNISAIETEMAQRCIVFNQRRISETAQQFMSGEIPQQEDETDPLPENPL